MKMKNLVLHGTRGLQMPTKLFCSGLRWVDAALKAKCDVMKEECLGRQRY